MTTAVSPLNCSTCPHLYDDDDHWLLSNTSLADQLAPSKLVRNKRRAERQREHQRKDRKHHGKVIIQLAFLFVDRVS